MADGEPTDRTLVVAQNETGRRLDRVLAAQLGLPRAEVKRLLESGRVAVDGRVVSVRAKGRPLRPGSRICVRAFARPRDRRIVPEPESPITLLAQGPGWLSVDKPPGMPVHPLAEDEAGTLLGAVVARVPEIQGVGEGGLRSGLVHRLDVDTSGVLLLATQQPVWERLRAAFREHRVRKVYRALVLGRPPRTGAAALRLRVARHRPARVAVVGPVTADPGEGRAARLSWRCLQQFEQAALLEVHPVTGFLHQIRVILAHRGYPVAGDAVYGEGVVPGWAPRHMLHAAHLELDEIRASSADPPDFRAALRMLRGSAAGS